jgi:pilus assembly protein CpaF
MAWFRRDSDFKDEEMLHKPIVGDSENAGPAGERKDEWYLTLKRELHKEVISAIDRGQLETMTEEELQVEVRFKAEQISRKNFEQLSPAEREKLVEEVLDEAFGYGPIESLMRDYEIADILINGPRQIYVEKAGRLVQVDLAFHDEDHLLQIIQRIVAASGRRIDEKSPMVDARLPDGSRLNAVIKPLALNGPLVSIRRFGARPLTTDDLLKYGSITPEMVEFLSGCVKARINILISGGTGSGKTTLLNCLSRYIPKAERIATIEDAAELMLQQPHVVKMETRGANLEGEGTITMRDLVRNALRMRPDRIIVGECRGPEALDMLQSMNTGHEGSLTTIHANTPRDSLTRLEMMIGMGGIDLPIWVIRKQVAASINIIVQVSRLIGGKRKVTKISEVTGIESDTVMMHDIFEFVQTGVDENHAAIGYFRATGIRPECLAKLTSAGVELPFELFEPRQLKLWSKPTATQV